METGLNGQMQIGLKIRVLAKSKRQLSRAKCVEEKGYKWAGHQKRSGQKYKQVKNTSEQGRKIHESKTKKIESWLNKKTANT